ncbi:hypothetical protein ACFPES_15660 [Paenibacillus sp. GCM10023248]|uniref:hypothetical protein n=1 Tax=Bacillus sp. 3255 TaxID=2817904 RepID=UPI00286B73D5|nr:hypothetical protein [Bacillus sp. 3255]MDD9268476.1 hypothetical protein [Paenibacillus sp. MAHUQ-63]
MIVIHKLLLEAAFFLALLAAVLIVSKRDASFFAMKWSERDERVISLISTFH